MFIERIFVAGHHHPCKQQGTATGNNIHFSFVTHKGFNRSAVNAGMNRHEIHAFFRMGTDNPQEILGGDFQQILFQITDGIIHRNGTDHGRRFSDQFPTERVGLAVIAQVHNGFGTEFQSHVNLLHFNVIVFAVAGDTQIDIDFCPQTGTDSFRRNRSMVNVAGNRHFALGNRGHDFFRRGIFLFGNDFHFRGNDSLFGGFHLCFVISHHADFLSNVFIFELTPIVKPVIHRAGAFS